MSPDTTTWDRLTCEARDIVTAAEQVGVTMRVVGSAGIRLHCAGPGALMDRLGRPAKDIDFVVPQQHRKGMRRLLEGRGYAVDRDLLVAMEGRRYSFTHVERSIEVDVFVQRLDFCHPIEVRDRLELHPVTIPIEELLLQKLQIHEMTTTDTMDAAVILATHQRQPLNEDFDPGEALDTGHIAGLLAQDWGFHHTATANLRRVQEAVDSNAVDLGAAWNPAASALAGALQAAIDDAPKSFAWRLRDRVGERKQWWQDVDEKESAY